MDTRLRAWARTGEYGDGSETVPEGTPRRDRGLPGAGWLHGVLMAALVPVGIVVGTLFAAAYLVRLLTLPLALLAGSARARRE